MPSREEIAAQVAKELGITVMDDDSRWLAPNGSYMFEIPPAVRDALIDAKVAEEHYQCAMESFNESIAEWKPRAEIAETKLAEETEQCAKVVEGCIARLAPGFDGYVRWGIEIATRIRSRIDAKVELAEREQANGPQFVSFLETLEKINRIRQSIVGSQQVNWSEHIYHLVAALEAAGFKTLGYDEERENFGTMLDRTLAAELRVKELSEAIKMLYEECEARSQPRGFVIERARAVLSEG